MPPPNATQTFTVGYFNLFANSLPGLKLWLDGNSVDSDHSTADSIANGTAIGSWKDRSVSTNHATQGTVSNRPTYNASVLNGKGTLSYTASQSSDITGDSSIRTIVTVLRQAAGQTSTSKPFGGNLFATTSNGKFGLQRQGSGMIDSGSSSKSFAVVTLQMASGNYAIYVNGNEKGTGTDPNIPAAFDKIGNDFAGDIAEIVAYDRAFNANVREKLEGYLAHKWGLTSSFSSSFNYKVAKPAFGGAQVLTFQPLSDKQVNQTVNLVLSADSGLTSFTYDSNDSTVVSFSGNVATGLKVGKVRITATQAGDGNWLPASAYQDWIVTATPRSDQTITFNAISNKNALSANFNLSATASSTLPVTYQVVSGSNVATVTSSGTIDVLGTGVATIRASQDGNSSFNPAPTVERTLTVSKAAQTITFGALPNQNLSAGVYTLNGSASSGLGVSFTSSDSSVASISGNIATLVAGGTVQIATNQGGNSIYAAATPVNQNLTIIDDTLQTQTITWSQNLSSLSYGLSDINMYATANSNLPITYTITSGAGVIDINGTKLKILGAGSAVVTASQNGNGQWAAASTVDKSIVVAKSNQDIVRNNNHATLLNLTKDSGDPEFTPLIKSIKQGTTIGTGLPITYTSSNTNVVQITGANARLKMVGGGTSTITVSQVGSSGYNAANAKTFTVTVTELSPYTDSLPNLILWLDGKDVNADRMPESPSNFLANAKVSAWSDRSGNGNSLTQANSGNHPTYESSGGLSFDGNSDFLDSTLPSLLQGSPAFTIFLVAESQQSGGRLLQLGNTAGTGLQIIGFHESGSIVYNDGNHSATQNFSTSATIGVWKKSSGNTTPGIQFSRFGTNIPLTAPATPKSINLPANTSVTSSKINLGKGSNGTSNEYFKGIIREVLVFNSYLDDYFQKRVEGYLANKWGSKASLSNQHPFKVTPPTFGGSQSINLAHTNLGVDVSDNVHFMSIFDTPFKLVGSYATSGLPITYETNSSSVLSVNSAGLLKPQGVGKVRVTLKQAGDSHFTAASNINFNMKILGKRSQSITFAPIPNKKPNDSNFTISATSSSSLPVSFTSSDTSIATVTSGGTVSIVANGQVTITASQAGNGTYAAAANADQSFTIGDLMTVSFDPIGTMGNSQTVNVRAWANDARNGALLNGTTGISIVYQIVSGPASISGNNLATSASGSGTVVLKATVSGSSYAPGTASISFSVDGSGQGQSITFNKGIKGGLRDVQLSGRPISLGRMAFSDSNLPITFTLIDNPNKVAKIVGVGQKAQLLIAPKDGNNGEKFSGFGGSSDLSIKIRASQSGGSLGGQQYHEALSVEHSIKIKKPGKNAFYDARKLDERFDIKKAAFDNRMARLGKSGDKAAYLFNRDDQDSDGDGLTNLEERAFGGDSLMGDKGSSKPRAIRKRDGYEYISFKRYQDTFNDGDDRIEYIVETSRDLRTWVSDSDTTNGPLQFGSAVDLGGGMEKVVFRSREKRTDNGGKQLFIRVRVKSK
ncbi:Ig-like domain-containing protein [Opitutales bacterium]|nr:Ig-like domain-containing protein [Opitutales bacterium]